MDVRTTVCAASLVAVIALPAGWSPAAVHAQSVKRQPIERLSAVTVNMSTVGRPGADKVEIVIERWSSERERDALIATLKDKGPEALLSALQKMPRVGYIRRAGGGRRLDLHFARERKLDDGGRQIVLATDRPISAWEAMNRPRSTDYDFTLADIASTATARASASCRSRPDPRQWQDRDGRDRRFRQRAGAHDGRHLGAR